MNLFKTYSAIAVMTLLGMHQSHAQGWTKPYTSPTATGSCGGLTPGLTADFVSTPVVSSTLFPTVFPLRIVKMTFWLNPTSGKADIYMVEKGGAGTLGRVLYYNGTNKTLTPIGTIPGVYLGFNEQGVFGIALNPKTFDADNFLYILYSVGSSGDPSSTNGFRLSRFKVNATTKVMDLASEKKMLHIPAGTAGRWHTGGSMQFDNFGNLYITVGDNEAGAMGPANTADLRGGILRIKPDSTAPNGYTIPAGNFGEYWAQQWQNKGMTARAAAYRDPAIVKPEIYVKGSRNPYGSGADKNRLGWIAWGECGPDYSTFKGEEWNLATHPAFSGWPYWVGDAVKQPSFPNGYNEKPEPNDQAAWDKFFPSSNTPAVPVNNWSAATGYDTLPPMHQPVYSYGTGGCAQGAVIVRYDGNIRNPGMMPPHLDNTILLSELGQNIYAVKIDPVTGANVGTITNVFTGIPRSKTEPSLGSSIDFQQGPDGALYTVNWGAGCCDGDRGASEYEGIARISYTGTCQDPGLTVSLEKQVIRTDVPWLHLGANTLSVMAEGPHEIKIINAQGRVLLSLQGEGYKDYALPADLPSASVKYIHVKTNLGSVIRGFLNP